MRILKKLLCTLLGHNDVVIVTGNNYDPNEGLYSLTRGSSTWGWFHCSRCGRDERFQYDE